MPPRAASGKRRRRSEPGNGTNSSTQVITSDVDNKVSPEDSFVAIYGSKKQKITSGSNAIVATSGMSDMNDGEPDQIPVAPTSKPLPKPKVSAGKKRKQASLAGPKSSKESKQTTSASSSSPPSAKRLKRKAASESKNTPIGKSAAASTPNTNGKAASSPKVEKNAAVDPRALTNGVAAKVLAVKTFVGTMSDPLVPRTGRDGRFLHISEIDLECVLAAAAMDYELGDPNNIRSSDVEEIIDARFEATNRLTGQKIDMVVINTKKSSSFENDIQMKVQGCGLHKVNLIETELEMHARAILCLKKWVTFEGDIQGGLDLGFSRFDVEKATQFEDSTVFFERTLCNVLQRDKAKKEKEGGWLSRLSPSREVIRTKSTDLSGVALLQPLRLMSERGC